MTKSCEVKSKPKSVGELIKTWGFWKPVIGVIIGGGGGFLYYYFIGCSSGSCAITSNPWASTFVGALFGFLLTSRSCGC